MPINPIEFHLPSVTSTSDYARELLRTYPYVFVSALHQTAGRGRNGRVWRGDFGTNVYCSLGITHSADPSVIDLSTYMARGALASIAVLREFAPRETFRLKYPNDVQAMHSNTWSKIAGVLVEHDFQGQRCTSSITGIGINVGQKQFENTINQACTSLYLMGYNADLPRFVQHLKSTLTELGDISSDQIFQQWVAELGILGRRVRILDDPSSWNVVRVLEDGRLHVRSEVTQTDRTVSDGDTIRYED